MTIPSVSSSTSSSPPAPPPQSYSPKTRELDRRDAMGRRRSPHSGVVTGQRKQQKQMFKLLSLSPPPTTSPRSMASNSRRRPQRQQQHRRTSSSPLLPLHQSKSLSPTTSPCLSRKCLRQDPSHSTDGRMVQNTTDATETSTRGAAVSGSGDSVSCCSSSYYSEYTIDEHSSSCYNHQSHHRSHRHHRRLSSHDEYDFEEYIIEEREDEEEEEVVLDDDHDDDESDIQSHGGNDNAKMIANSWDSSDDECDHRRETTARASIGELSAHTLSTAFTLNDLASIDTVSSLDVEDCDDNDFALDDDDNDESIEMATTTDCPTIKNIKMLPYNDDDFHRGQDADEMINEVDDISLDTLERERRRTDKHTEAHELREVFCHSPISHRKKCGTSCHHHRHQKHPPSHAEDVRVNAVLHSMHESMNCIDTSSRRSRIKLGSIQRCHSFDCTTNISKDENSPRSLEAAKMYLAGLSTTFPGRGTIAVNSSSQQRHDDDLSGEYATEEIRLDDDCVEDDDEKQIDRNTSNRPSTGSAASSYYEEVIIEE